MSDLIDRQAAIRWVKTECNPYGKPTLDFESGKKVIEHLKQMPSAQTEREKGKWIVEPDGRLHCSVCSEITTNRIITGGYLIYDIAPIRKYMKFCPTCGSYNGGDGERNEIN